VAEQLSNLVRRQNWGEMGALIDDQILDAFCTMAPPQELGAAMRERYQGLADHLSVYTPYNPGERDDFWKNLIIELKA
jgi:hypothetical protein